MTAIASFEATVSKLPARDPAEGSDKCKFVVRVCPNLRQGIDCGPRIDWALDRGYGRKMAAVTM
jgi:hypothetical protein